MRVTLAVVACLPLLLIEAAVMPGAASGEDQPRRADSGRLVIVAPKSFAAALKDYVAHKSQQLPTQLVPLEDVLSQSAAGQDDAEKLKRWIYQQWREQQLRYVLLVGDASVMPVRYMVLDRITPVAFDYAFYPSDLYYADVAKADGSFDDWNQAKDGFHAQYFGEVRGEKNKNDPINYDAVSYLPELAVGRWPVASPRQAQVVAAKTMSYENRLKGRKKPGAKRALFLAIDGWVDSRPRLNDAAQKLSPGWQVERRFYGQMPPPSEPELYRLLNEGIGLVVHAGHGEIDRWDQVASLAGFRQFVRNADRLPLIFSAGCSTAYFAPLPPYEAYIDASGKRHAGTNRGEVFSSPPPPPAVYQPLQQQPGLGVQLVTGGPAGCVAYFGCNTGSQPCGLTLVSALVAGVGDGRPDYRLGDAWRDAVKQYFEREKLAQLSPDPGWYPPSIFFQAMKFMLFGDPTLLLPEKKAS